jgi:hypothetical protein
MATTKQAKQFKRDTDAADSAWSDPGSTKGIADRWTHRHVRGLYLTAGHNARKGPDYTTFTVPENQSPWKVYALGPHPTVPNYWHLALVASGTAESVALAKQAAERAALAWSES